MNDLLFEESSLYTAAQEKFLRETIDQRRTVMVRDGSDHALCLAKARGR